MLSCNISVDKTFLTSMLNNLLTILKGLTLWCLDFNLMWNQHKWLIISIPHPNGEYSYFCHYSYIPYYFSPYIIILSDISFVTHLLRDYESQSFQSFKIFGQKCDTVHLIFHLLKFGFVVMWGHYDEKLHQLKLWYF